MGVMNAVVILRISGTSFLFRAEREWLRARSVTCCACRPPVCSSVRSQRASGSGRLLPVRASAGRAKLASPGRCRTISTTTRWSGASIRRLRPRPKIGGPSRVAAQGRDAAAGLGGVPRSPSRRLRPQWVLRALPGGARGLDGGLTNVREIVDDPKRLYQTMRRVTVRKSDEPITGEQTSRGSAPTR